MKVEITADALVEAVAKAYKEQKPDFRKKLFDALAVAAQETHFNEAYVDPNSAEKNGEAIGLWIAHSNGWVIENIAAVAIGAFEDANAHAVCEAIRETL